MSDLRYGSLVCMNEIKPKFPPKVQQIWDDCGTHVTSMETEQGAKEIEFFVQTLLKNVVQSHEFANWKEDLIEILEEEGYLNYERK